MTRLLTSLLLLIAALSCSPLRAEGLTRDEALKLGADNEGAKNGKFWFEHGDASPPFTHSGHITIDRGSQITMSLNDAATRGLGVDAPYNDGSQTRLDFFTSSKGKGWVVAHVLKPEVAMSKPEPIRDRRPSDHVELSGAGRMAIREGDQAFLESLLKRGLEINEALDFESGDTPLHLAVSSGKMPVVKFLLRNGAKPTIRNQFGRRPIDEAMRDQNKELCELLAKPVEEEPLIESIPSGIISEVLVRQSGDDLVFISWNGKDPSAELLAEVRKTLPKARPASKTNTLDRRPLGALSWYQDKDSKEFGRLIEVTLKKDGAVWNASVRNSSGPVMAGGGWKGQVRKAYGWWHTDEVSGWVE